MSIPPDLEDYLSPSRFIDSAHPEIRERAALLADSRDSKLENAVTLYYWVRDEIRYNPYAVIPREDFFLASTTLRNREGWCVPKAVLLAALCRAAGIPARLGFADVRNHLSTERMREYMQTDVFYFHGYTSLLLENRWVKATPAFNIQLCDKFGLLPLEFNGREDSLYHPFDRAGNLHMEYVNDRGEQLDLPYDEMMGVFHQHYPAMMEAMEDLSLQSDQWRADVERETAPS